jgi:hypothetical protein
MPQDDSFEVVEVTGRRLVRICASTCPTDPEPGVIVFARIDDPLEWHRFFLDAGISFWATWPDDAIDEELQDDTCHIQEYLADLLPCTIVRAYADLVEGANASRITLALDNGIVVRLETIGDVFDGPTRLRVITAE